MLVFKEYLQGLGDLAGMLRKIILYLIRVTLIIYNNRVKSVSFSRITPFLKLVGAGCWMLDAGCWMLGDGGGCWMLDDG